MEYVVGKKYVTGDGSVFEFVKYDGGYNCFNAIDLKSAYAKSLDGFYKFTTKSYMLLKEYVEEVPIGDKTISEIIEDQSTEEEFKWTEQTSQSMAPEDDPERNGFITEEYREHSKIIAKKVRLATQKELLIGTEEEVDGPGIMFQIGSVHDGKECASIDRLMDRLDSRDPLSSAEFRIFDFSGYPAEELKEIGYLRVALEMVGVSTEDKIADLMRMVVIKWNELKGEFSINDSSTIIVEWVKKWKEYEQKNKEKEG